MGTLKRFFWLFLLALNGEAMSGLAHAAPDLLARYHFIGSAGLTNDTNATKLKEIWSLPVSVDFREQVLQKLARAPGQLLAHRIKTSSDQSLLLRPLLDDLLVAESRAELRQSNDGSGEAVLAIRLNDDSAAVWQKNLSAVLASWADSPARKISLRQFPGWEIKSLASPLVIRCVRAVDWVVVGVGQKELPLMESWLGEIAGKKNLPGLTGDHWFEADMDWPRLRDWLSLDSALFKLARTEIVVSGRNENLRTTIRAVYPDKLSWKTAPWQIPTNLVKDPIISFTAAQNISALLSNPFPLQKLSVSPLAGQIFLWAQAQSPFHSAAALPQVDADESFIRLTKEMPAAFNAALEKQKAGKIILSTNHSTLLWQGLSLLAPDLRATNGFLFGVLFPPARFKDPIPSELISQVAGRTNLIYYDWEITQERLGQWQLLSQLLPPFAPKTEQTPVPVSKPQPSSNATNKTSIGHPSSARLRMLDQTWQSAVGKYLGNTVTEVTQTGVNEVSFLRKSPLGFTGVELIMLTRWLNDPQFPLFGYQLPPAAAKK